MTTNITPMLPKFGTPTLGSFAFTDNKLGIGKITSISKTEVEIEYFVSISDQRKIIVPLNRILPTRLSPQTRCYAKDDENWQVGRAIKTLDDTVEIDFPEGHSDFIPIEDVYVRCLLPIDNPTDVLSHWGHETVFFYQKRKCFIDGVLRQRRVSSGLNGLLSASIQFMKHQVETAREILEDPVRRYMLADEVGLGKTIESGIVIRQTLLDNPDASVLVISPASLQDQWKEEMECKFHINQWPGQVEFVSYEECKGINTISAYNLIVIDEAHHLAEKSFSQSEYQKDVFYTCKSLAHKSSGLLLLSATPALHHEKAFLCLLNLLDPKHFPLDKEEEFVELVSKREVIAKILLGFSEHKPNVLIKSSLRKLIEYFSKDESILGHTEELALCLAEETVDVARRNELINTIRTLISERYRIHRRIIRHRRNDVWDIQRRLPKEDYADDAREIEILNLLNDWRLNALQFSELGNPERAQYQRCYFTLLSAFYSSLTFFELVVKYRLRKENPSLITYEFSESDCKSLSCPYFEAEQELLQDILLTLEVDAEEDTYSRESLLEDCLSMLKDNRTTNKVVVFSSFSWIANNIAGKLKDTFGDNAVVLIHKGMSRDEIHHCVSLFKDSETHFVLVSDRIGEEGLNLQFANTLIHFDLPWSVSQLEQRIGRLDRIGQENKIKSYVFLGTEENELNSPLIIYYNFLNTALGVFERSINSVQFVIEGISEHLKTWIFNDYGDLNEEDIGDKIDSFKKDIEEELMRIHGQDLLDESISSRKGYSQYFEKLVESEEDASLVYKEFDPWIKTALMFGASGNMTYNWAKGTLVPLDILTRKLDSQTKFKGTYCRSKAIDKALPPFRIGNHFIDTITDYINWDDRGKTYAIWRHSCEVSYEWKGFRFDVIVEADIDESLDPYEAKALQRKADSFFPPKLYTVYIEVGSEDAEKNEHILSQLQKPIYKAVGGYDENLTKEKAFILRNHFTDYQWNNYCQKAYQSVFDSVINSNMFVEQKEESLKAVNKYLIIKQEQLLIHQDHIFQQKDQLEVELALNKYLVSSIEFPKVKVDAIGFIWLSNTQLSEVLQANDH